MSTSPHLHPMAPDSLRPRSAPQASQAQSPVQLAPSAPSQPEPMLHPARFEPAQLPPVLRPTEPEPPVEDDPFPDLLLCAEEDEDDDDEPDAVPTESMPIPVCVPLFDLSIPPQRRGKRKKG